MNSPIFMNSTHEKVIGTLRDTFERNDRGVQAESDQYIKGWQDAFATVEAELNHLFTVEAEKASEGTAQERKAILDKAAECVCGQREQEYGTPETTSRALPDCGARTLAILSPPMTLPCSWRC